MALKEDLSKQGDLLFRYRSYLPLLLLPLFVWAISRTGYYENIMGERYVLFYEIFCLLISFLGLVVRSLVIGFVPEGTSGRNTKAQRAAHLNTRGIYSMVRHPLYLGNFLMFTGIVLFTKVWSFTVIVSLIFWIYYERIMYREEDFLRGKYRDDYMKWAEKTPAFLPDLTKWQPPQRKFSFARVLRREYRGIFEVILSITFIKVLSNYFTYGEITLARGWLILLITGFIYFIISRIIVKIVRKRKSKNKSR